MMKDIGGVAILLFVAGGFALVIWRAPAILRGNERHVPFEGRFGVQAHTYLTFLLWFIPSWLFLGDAIVGGILLPADSPAQPATVAIAVVALLAAVPGALLHFCVATFGRPQFLVPRPYRGRPSGLSRRWTRWQRRRAGLPPTNHTVEIYDIAHPGEEPLLHAACTDPSCHWIAFPDRTGLGQPEEDNLREQAGRHTSTVRPGVVRPLA
jgi:hypothetical protein